MQRCDARQCNASSASVLQLWEFHDADVVGHGRRVWHTGVRHLLKKCSYRGKIKGLERPKKYGSVTIEHGHLACQAMSLVLPNESEVHHQRTRKVARDEGISIKQGSSTTEGRRDGHPVIG
ncbi:hypothetical protein FOPG_01508 [Fusarium oxysporum f. sp. conglutinans race 2 54008]|jgi:hypothetical protein|uniref:Uncharacterized protein n=3 Tax=Fusarium oxysporum TaxID=5507 RepID=X0MYP7_FUSOX|nr:hypothetical protein FOVG_04914 [Fusarium oxysporum f. sp. pisi HDV247]EXL87195.1 hypothetical protein FOPG_01508 [Fusarium oxysporum f. sp. conglutinans race 2 54008]EXM25510.1 hypothetical protein FOTG_07901 [Fusarium oxysporum f. sp. vasinfectum 25433]KAI8409704.1 hypothetical protein FOFC_09546 [Fusarium oxysporum]KAJ4053813.1 hypothetical protein NW758_003608 [Fusarium oxysporum]